MIGRAHQRFLQSRFGLPNTVNEAAIKAECKSGLWTVEMPKRAESKSKQAKDQVTHNGN
jgi:HSP20 family molecular chaperone IbpA